MQADFGKIIEIQQNQDGSRQGIIAWPGALGKRPGAGQYFQAHNLKETSAPAAISLFAGGLHPYAGGADQLQTAPGMPDSWLPGDPLLLRGPIGNKFRIPEDARRITLAAFGPFSAHLLPLAGEVLAAGGEVSLLMDGDFPILPASIEVSPLANLTEALHWADFAACATPLENLDAAREQLSAAGGHTRMQVLVHAPMPCGALAACGVCAFTSSQAQHDTCL
ncbi:MAG: hypothetical protein P8046_06715 [Anaerolineales bacterium]